MKTEQPTQQTTNRFNPLPGGKKMTKTTYRFRVRTSTSFIAMTAMMAGTTAPAFANIDNTAIVNGSVGGTPVYASGSEPNDSVSIPVDTLAPELTVTKAGTVTDSNGDGTTGNVGDEITYTITVTNTGNATITDTEVTDANADAGSITYAATDDTDGLNGIDSLAPSASATVTAVHTITQADIDAGGVTNTATATGNDPTGTPVSDDSDSVNPADDTGGGDDPTVTPITQTPELTVVKGGTLADTNGDGLDSVGDVITYTITITNTGNVTITDTEVTDANADSGSITYAAADDTDGLNGIDSLAPGASAIVTATHTLTQADIDAGNVTNTATAAGDDPGGTPVTDDSDSVNPADDTGGGDDPTVTPLTQTPALTIVKSASPTTPANVGDLITYTYTVTNTGNIAINDVVVSDTHEGVQLLPIDVTTGPWNETLSSGSGTDAATNGSWDVLNPGDIITFTYEHTVTQAEFDAQ